MSNPFTYGLDERNLRMQLKDLEYPLPENAWHKFESYAATKVVTKTPGTFGNLRLNLNRNIIVPAVFGLVVVSFSILLVNFVSIKPRELPQQTNVPSQSKVSTAPANQTVKPAKHSPKKSTIEKPVVVDQTELAMDSAPSAENTHSSMMGDKAGLASTPSTNVAETLPAVIDSGSSINPGIVSNDMKTDSETVAKKKRRKQLDPAAQLQEEIKPTVVTDNPEEEEVRPN